MPAHLLMNDDATTQRDTVERLADSFMASYRTGACPSVDEYALQFPELADQLRELLTALVILEQNAPHREAAAPPFPGPTWTVAPREIGDFLIVREIARGGMGVVYEAVQQSLGRHVALKVLSTSGLLSPSHLERFRLEARAAARLHHTHIVPVFGVGEHHGLHYYAMQFIQGHSLDLVINELRLLRRTQQGDKTVMAAADPFTRLVADGLLTGQFRVVADEVVDTAGNGDKFSAEAGPFETQPQEPTLPVMHSQTEFTSSPGGREFYRSVARVGLQVAEALAYAHGEGILHRDIKPSNLLLDAKGNVWVTDFGLAKAEGCDGLTQSGDFVGTLRYMPPERLDGRSDRRGDIYSLGATLYELLSLRPFLHAASRGQLVDKIQREDPPALSKSDRSIPADLETIVLKALAKEPTLRYCSAEELAEDLRRFLADRSILARRSTPVEQLVRWCRRNPRWAAMFAMVAGLLLVIAVGSSALSARALRAERQTLAELFQAKVNEARATTLSGRPGQRFRTLAIVNEARRIAAKLELPADRLADLRNVAIVAFTLPDLYPRREWEGFPRKSFAVDFDDNLQIYARTDVDGSCTVRQVEGDVELHHVAGDGTGVGLYWPLLSRDGRSLVVSERGKRAKLWEIQGDQPHLVLTLNDVWTTEYHPHGRQVAFAHTDGTITTHDVNTGQVIHRLAPSGLTRELAIALHPTVPLVAVGSYFGRMVQVRDLRTGQVIKSMEVSRTEGGHVAWHPSGEWLAATDGAEGRIHVFDRATFQRQFTIGPVDGGARIFFDHSGNQLAVVGWDQRIQLFDFQTGKLRFEILDANPTNCPRFSGDDLRLAGFTRGTTMGVWQIGAGLEYHWFARRKLPRQTGYESCATSPDGRMLAVAMTDGVDFWDLEVGERLATLPLDGPRFVHFEPPKAMAGPHAPACPTKPLFPCPLDRGAVLIGETSGTYRWPIRQDPDDAGLMTIGPPEALRLPPGNFRQSRDGKVRIMGFSNAGSFQPWAGIWIQHADRPASIQQLLAGASLYMGTISPDGRWLVTSDLYTERTRLWDAGTGEFTRQLPCRGRYLEFSPDGRWLAASGPRGGLVDARTWQEVRQLPEVARFSPDSKIMVVQGYTSLIRLVDVVSGDELCRLEDPNAAPARDIAFTPDSGKLVTIGYSEGIRVWDLPRLRQRLAAQGLDWDSVGNERVERPARLRGLRLAAKQSRPTQPRPLAIQIEMGDFAQLRPRQMSDNLDLAIDAAPQIPQRWIARAEFHQAAGRHEHALADLRQALTCAQGLNDSRLQAKVCNELARLLCLAPERFRDAQQALTLAEQAVELRPGEWTYTNTLGIAYYRLGRFPEAVVTLERSLADDNGHANAADLCFLAMCHLQLNDQPRARECLEQAQGWHDRNANDLPSEDRRELQCILDEAEKLFASYEG